MIDGFWTVEFEGVPNFLGGAVAVLTKNRIFGGDSQYYYSGFYEVKSGALTALIQVAAFIPGATTVFGSRDRSFSIQISGNADGQTITGLAVRSDMPTHKLNVILRKRAELPD